MHTSPIPLALALLVMCSCASTARSQMRLVEDFEYDSGDSLTARGWATNQSTITNAVLVSPQGLLYPTHPGSGIGNAAQMFPSGQDVYREFEAATEGTLYVFLMICVKEASSGDYILHLQPSPQSTSFFGRLFIRQATNGNLAFGIAKRGTNASPTHLYSDSIYSLETTYCLALKYTFKTGSSTDDEASLFVFSQTPVPGVEPLTPTVGPVTDATNDASNLSVLTLRQGDASRAPTVLVDGLRICTTWDACLPVTLQAFSAVALPMQRVQLSWITTTEVNCYGFTVQRAEGRPDLLADIPGAFIPGQGTSLIPTSYSYQDTVPSAGSWFYRLRQSDLDGTSRYSETIVVELPTAVESTPSHGFFLKSNYPNPFNAETTIRFGIPVRTHVSLEIYNALGMDMSRLIDGLLEPGEYVLSIEADDWPGGVYFCRMRAAGLERVTRMVLVR
jgi:hypothetical protein